MLCLCATSVVFRRYDKVLTSASNPPVRTMSASDTASKGATQFLRKHQRGGSVTRERSRGAGINSMLYNVAPCTECCGCWVRP